MSVIKISDLSQDSFLSELSDAEMQVQGGTYYDYSYNVFYFGGVGADDVGTIGQNNGYSVGEIEYNYYF